MHRSSMPRSSGPSKGPPTKLLRGRRPFSRCAASGVKRWNVSVGRIDDQPRSIPFGEVENLQPPLVRPADLSVCQSGNRLFRSLLTDTGDVFSAQIGELTTLEFLRPFERRGVLVRVGVDALEIGIAPLCAGRRVRRCGSCGCRGLCCSRGKADRRDQRQDDADECEKSSLHPTGSLTVCVTIIDHCRRFASGFAVSKEGKAGASAIPV